METPCEHTAAAAAKGVAPFSATAVATIPATAQHKASSASNLPQADLRSYFGGAQGSTEVVVDVTPTASQHQADDRSDQASKVQRTSELAKITELNISSGIKLVKVSTKVTEEALVAAYYKDAQTAANCKPYGKPDFSLLPEQLKPTLALAQSEKTASADMTIVEQGVSLSTHWVDQGMRVETQPMGSWSLGEASPWDMKTSWPLGAQSV